MTLPAEINTDAVDTSPPPEGHVRAIPFGVPGAEPVVIKMGGDVVNVAKAAWASIAAGTSQSDDPFAPRYVGSISATRDGRNELEPIWPTTNPKWLARLYSRSNILGPCIDSMAANVGGHGYRLVPRLKQDDPRSETFAAEIEAERADLEERLKTLHPEPKTQIPQLRSLMRERGEAVGWSGFEIVRDQLGEIAWLEPIHPQLFRWCPLDPATVEWDQPIYDTRELAWTSRKVPRRFRRFLQYVEWDQRQFRYFKEFGDPRVMSAESGKFHASESAIPEGETAATEILVTLELRRIHGTYPMPRWIGVDSEIVNSWLANQLNSSRLRRPIPPGLLLVSGGRIGGVDEETVASSVAEHQEASRANTFPVISAIPAGGMAGAVSGIGGAPTVRMEWVPLDRVIADDALFVDFDTANRDKVRAAFRLSKMATGELTDVNRASANAGTAHDESDVYAPARRTEDLAIFEPLMADWGVRFWRVEGNPTPGLSDEALPELLKEGRESGALTPNDSRQLISKRLRVDLPPIAQPWADVPVLLLNMGATSTDDLDDLSALTPPTPAAVATPAADPPANDGGTAEGDAGTEDEGRAELVRRARELHDDALRLLADNDED